MSDDHLVEILDRLARAGVSITTRAIADEVTAVDLTLVQWRALVVVCEAGMAGIRVGDLGRQLRVAAPGASRLVRRLELRDLIVVARDAPDRRAAVVRATDAGRATWTAVNLRRRGHIQAAIDRVGAGGEDLGDRLNAIAIALIEGE